MTVRELYEAVNGDYEDVMGRLMKEERVVKFLKKFVDGTEMDDINAALEKEDWESAFRAVHTLKGVSANLGLTALYENSHVLCEELRPLVKPDKDITEMVEAVRADYERSVRAIKELD